MLSNAVWNPPANLSLPIAARLKPAQNIPHDTTETPAAATLRKAVEVALGTRPLHQGAFTGLGLPDELRGLAEVIRALFNRKDHT